MSPKFKKGLANQGAFKLGLLLCDAVLTLLASILALFLRDIIFVQKSGGIMNAVRMFYPATFLVFFIGLYIADAFNFDSLRSHSELLITVLKGVLITVLIASALEYSLRIHFFPRGYMFLFALVAIPLLYAERQIAVSLWHRTIHPDRIVLIGNRADVEAVLRRIKRRELNIFSSIVGIMVPEANNGDIMGIPVMEFDRKNIVHAIDELDVNRVIIVSPMDHQELIDELHRSSNEGVRIEVLPGIYEILIGRPDYSLIADLPLIQLTRDNPPEWYFIAKRLMDIVVSLLLLVLTSPLFLLIAVAIKLTSRGPIFHRQTRVGKDFRPFTIYKFRTMRADAQTEDRVVTDPNDPRITPIGRVLRKYHLDELPQLFNVLKGDMSLVGPRPEKIEFFEKYLNHVPGYRERQKVKPGLTGLAQVWGDHAIEPEFKLKYDLIYIYNRNILLDILILLKTVRIVCKGTGI